MLNQYNRFKREETGITGHIYSDNSKQSDAGFIDHICIEANRTGSDGNDVVMKKMVKKTILNNIETKKIVVFVRRV